MKKSHECLVGRQSFEKCPTAHPFQLGGSNSRVQNDDATEVSPAYRTFVALREMMSR